VRAERISPSIVAKQPEILAAESVQDADLRVLLAHWEKLRSARLQEAMPLRAVASAEIGRLLKYMHLCDVLDDGADFRWRIVGIAAFPGMHFLTGQLVSEHPDKETREHFPVLMRAVVDGKKPVRGLMLRPSGNLVESLWLPYGDTTVRQVLGMVATRKTSAEFMMSLEAEST
jgi:hypothetical protein